MIRIPRAISKELTLRFTNDDIIMDITGGTVWFTVRKVPAKSSVKDDDDALISVKQLPADLTDPTNGVTVIELTRDDTNIDTGEYLYDVQLKTDSGIYKKTFADRFIVIGDITRGY